jgi:recombination protein RecA
MKDFLVKKLNELVKMGTKKSQLEKEIGFPHNSLSAVLAGHKEMADSWVEKINAYFNKTTAKTKLVVTPMGVLTEKPSDEKIKAMKDAVDRINKDYGIGSVMFMGDKPDNDKTKVISTGSLTLDHALGVGGFPKGRIIEIYGMESSGKTTIAIHAIAEAQKLGGKCAFIDAEHAFDEQYAINLGVNINDLLISQPDYGEQALEIADRLILSGAYSIVVIDSVAALVPKSELEGEMGDSKMGLHARLMSQACRKMTASISRTNTICIFINQLRVKIGVLPHMNPEITTGGNALKFYASVRLDVRRSTQIKDGEDILGNLTKVKVVKNKVAPPFKVAEFNIIYGLGIDRAGEILDLAVEKDIIQKSGSWYSYNSNKLGQGAESVKQLFIDNEEIKNEIERKINDKKH